jgi:hypothetical protein
MSAVKLEQFGGMLPAWDPHLLPTGQAAFSKNGYLFSGALTGWRQPKALHTLANPNARMAYRIPTVTKTQARAYCIFPSQPNNGDQVILGDLTYTFVTALADLGNGNRGNPQDVLIGANTDFTAQNLAAAITADGNTNVNAGIKYGSQTASNGDVFIPIPNTTAPAGLVTPTFMDVAIGAGGYAAVLVGAVDFGASYNLVNVSETTGGARIKWMGDLLAITDTTTSLVGGSNPQFDTTITGAAVWLEFTDPDTNVVKSPIVDDQYNRYYFASPTQMPEYNTYDRIVAGKNPWLLGVPPPGCAVTLSVTGGGNNLTLGNYTQSGGDITTNGNWVYLQPVTTPGDTQIQDVQFRLGVLGTADPTSNFAAVVYDDNNGLPGNLLNTGIITKGITNTSVNISSFLNPTNLIGNTQYWIGIIIDKPNVFEGGPAGGGFGSANFPQTFSNGPPGTAPTQKAYTNLLSDGTNVSNGDKVTLGFQTYTFQTVLTNVGGNVLIGANADASLANLGACINAGAGAGTVYAAASSANTLVSAGVEGSLTLPIVALLQTTANTSVATTFSPVGSPPHLSFPDTVLLAGLATNQFGLNLWGDFITSDIIESRAYAYTWVSEYGEEGPPSPPTLLDGWSNGTWTLGLWQPPPDDLGVIRDLKNINIYRTVPGQGGSTVFFFVATVPIGTTTYVDTNPNNVIALNDVLKSTNWFPPPANLQGLSVMQNGMIAGFIGNEIWFCEPYQTHAWPPGNVMTVDYPIVGLGVTNGALVVCTASNPFVITGQTPGQMAQNKCAQPNPCLSRGSIIHGDGAVSYMSQNGLIQVTAAGVATNTTDLWFTRENWQQLTPQKYTRAIFLASSYYCLGSVSPPTVAAVDNSVAQQGFTIELDQDNTSFTIWPQPGGHRLGFNVLSSPTGADVQNVMTDTWTGIGLVVSGGKVYYFDFTDPNPVIIPYTWKSKIYQQNVKRSYEAMRVFFTVPPGTPAQGQYRNQAVASDPSWSTLPSTAYGYLKTYVDIDGTGNMTLIDAREIRSSGELLRLVDGFKAEQWQWQLDARVVISNVQIASSVKDLGNV